MRLLFEHLSLNSVCRKCDPSCSKVSVSGKKTILGGLPPPGTLLRYVESGTENSHADDHIIREI